MNIKLITLFIALMLPVALMAQKEDKKKIGKKKGQTENVETTKNAETAQNEDLQTITNLSQIITQLNNNNIELEKEKKHLQAIIDSLKTLPVQKVEVVNNQKEKIVRDSLNLAKNKIDMLLSENHNYKQQLEELNTVVKNIDAIVYKECILYPLSIRYNERRIRESLEALAAYRKLMNDNISNELKTAINVYLPFIEGKNPIYLKYTQDLMKFLDEIKLTGSPILTNALKNKYRTKLENLEYYKKYFEKRNAPPYQSIGFLDNKIEEVKHLLTCDKEVVNNDVKKVKESISPVFEKQDNGIHLQKQ